MSGFPLVIGSFCTMVFVIILRDGFGWACFSLIRVGYLYCGYLVQAIGVRLARGWFKNFWCNEGGDIREGTLRRKGDEQGFSTLLSTL